MKHSDLDELGLVPGGAIPLKNTDADKAVIERTYAVAAGELRQFVERFETLEAEKKDVAEQQKEVMAEAKGRGYDTKALKTIIKMRKMKPEDLAEGEAVVDLYRRALGMI